MSGYTSEFLAKLRHYVETSPLPLRTIAKEFEIGERTLYRIVEREGWVRPQRGLSPAFHAREKIRALLEAPAAKEESQDEPPAPDLSGEQPIPAIDRIAQLVEKELAAAEVMRAQLRTGACEPIDADRMARTLSTLTQTLQTLQRLRAGEMTHSNDDDDSPQDIDEFRCDLARRIDAFVASRTDSADAECGRTDAPLDDIRA